MSDLTDDLTDAFSEATDEETAATAAENVAAFAEQYDEDLTADDALDTLAEAPYDDFEHRFNWLVGELAAGEEDCTDTREFRLGGYDEFAADPDMAA
ncbi:hypothetical protein [Haloarcula litorea]|uniref:hypothetical protein n=1 Tax=Haloarcula litorea TaxID=3032579 RepID=UPI0023E8169A|nr:hypothetical protein [Halomicroarcula sp. GDY20]